MVKPQFEAGSDVKHKGVIKNDKMRRDILKNLEIWMLDMFTIVGKADSEVAGALQISLGDKYQVRVFLANLKR